jgi:hypothetical protein
MACENKKQITFEGKYPTMVQVARSAALICVIEYLGCSEAAFEWADSYDSKDWDRLRKCIAPTLRVRVTKKNKPRFATINS